MLNVLIVSINPAMLENCMGRDGFNRLEYFREAKKHRLGIRVVGFHLRLDQKVDMIRHDAGGVEMDLAELA